MNNEYQKIVSGGVTSPRGFKAGAASAGIKKNHDLDLAVLFSEKPGAAAGVFTTNLVKAAPVLLSRERIKGGAASAVVANSGCANACTGRQGLADAEEVAGTVARDLGIPAEHVLAASTGVIGPRLPMERVREGLKKIILTVDGGHDLARTILTTDTRPKEVAVRHTAAGYVIGGAAKGAGMIHPNMATMLAFLTTDAGIAPGLLDKVLRRAADVSFNMISVDGETSTNDTLLLLANGQSGGAEIMEGSPEAESFQRGLDAVCMELARAIVRDGEGATKLFEVTVTGAPSAEEARLAARTVTTSPLVKTAIHGSDPNWGRVLAAVGRSGARFDASRVDLRIGDVLLVRAGEPVGFDAAAVVTLLDRNEIGIRVDLNSGPAGATAWGCDLSAEYVRVNSQYTT
ncbi:MAG: bifunctional glutamate N-acetyltransferase/amino-acid acetyltransferase ArgJ [Chloroflexi bacterium]|nr:bifunctional glutamate N-acetyltransferase/amino-acid acetyltransferase ArgJ [Chloroflexota bacterium]